MEAHFAAAPRSEHGNLWAVAFQTGPAPRAPFMIAVLIDGPDLCPRLVAARRAMRCTGQASQRRWWVDLVYRKLSIRAHRASLQSTRVQPHRKWASHAAVLMDRAGWPTTTKLKLPSNITIIQLPPVRPNSTPWRISGSTYARTCSQTASSQHTRPFLMPDATHGTASSPDQEQSHQSE